MRLPRRYQKLVELEGRAALKIDELQRELIRTAKLLEKWRGARARARRALEKAEGLKLCGWCAMPEDSCECPDKLKEARR